MHRRVSDRRCRTSDNVPLISEQATSMYLTKRGNQKPVRADIIIPMQVKMTPTMAIASLEACASESRVPKPESKAPASPKTPAKIVKQIFCPFDSAIGYGQRVVATRCEEGKDKRSLMVTCILVNGYSFREVWPNVNDEFTNFREGGPTAHPSSRFWRRLNF